MRTEKETPLWKTISSIFVLCGMILIGISVFNLFDNATESMQADEYVQAATIVVKEKTGETKELLKTVQSEPDYEANPVMEMPTVEIDGREYIGVLNIPSLGLELSVLSEWSYDGLKVSPGRYYGSVYTDDIVICAHNYKSHFGSLGSLTPGADITFTDVDGNVFHYIATDSEIVSAYDVDYMISGDWDMTLYTCTGGGTRRITIRCTRIDAE